KKMHYRREVRQDVQAELTAHFEDELKDCTTDEQKQQKTQQLITEFGDVKLLAVLLRRAKKRCRPLWRTVTARTFQAIGVLILCFILYVVWFLSGKPAITTNYVAELNNMVRPVADESLNAAPLYIKAIELYEKRWDDVAELRSKTQPTPEEMELVENDLPRLLGKKYEEVTSEQKKRIEKWLTDNKDVFDLVVAGAKKPYHWQTYGGRGDTTEMMSIFMPKLSGFRRLARPLIWRARLRAERGQFKDAFEDVKSCYRLGQHIRGDKTLVEQLVGIAIEALSVRTIRDIVGGYEIDSAVLADFQRDFEQIIADENFAISFKAERLTMYDEIQRCFTSDRIGKGHLYLPRFRKISDLGSGYVEEGVEPFIFDLVYSVPFLFGHPNKEETLKSVNALYDYFEQLSLKTAVQRHAESDAIDDKFKELVNGNVFLRTLTPAVKRIAEIGNRVPTDVRAALTMIAIFRYNRDTGRYPQNLNQLVTDDYLKQLPIDSYSDKPLVYKKTEDNFILYSFGPDFKDDDGVSAKDSKGRVRQWRDNGDTVFWPVPKPQVKQ
ncbi:MAG: hypothetical protein IIB56_15015, partial [Planctomycetes bacterium]|nr:hypothetical protein [Planctomycetota bacterium]